MISDDSSSSEMNYEQFRALKQWIAGTRVADQSEMGLPAAAEVTDSLVSDDLVISVESDDDISYDAGSIKTHSSEENMEQALENYSLSAYGSDQSER